MREVLAQIKAFRMYHLSSLSLKGATPDDEEKAMQQKEADKFWGGLFRLFFMENDDQCRDDLVWFVLMPAEQEKHRIIGIFMRFARSPCKSAMSAGFQTPFLYGAVRINSFPTPRVIQD